MVKIVFAAVFAAAAASAVTTSVAQPAVTAQSDEELTVGLPVDAADAAQLSGFLRAAAEEQGYSRVRAYQGGVFITVDDSTISFMKDGDDFIMRVAFDTKYRYRPTEREPALHALKDKGTAIFAAAMAKQLR